MNPYMELPLIHQRFHKDHARSLGIDLAAANATSQAISELAYRLIVGIEGLAARYRTHRRAKRAVQDLSGLDDRMLKDIGIDRSEIRSAVHETLRAESRADSAPPVRVDRIVSLPRHLRTAANDNRRARHLESA